MAIDRGVTVAFAPRADRRLRVHALAFAATLEVALDSLVPAAGVEAGWLAYVAGMAWSLERAGHRLAGADLVLGGDLPMGAGLSSSAALELAVARALCAVSAVPWNAAAVARLGWQAENDFVGVPCGPMDQLASALSREGCASLLDCRSLEWQDVPLPPGASFVVLDTGVRRSLVSSAYAERRRCCQAAVEVLRRADPGIAALRDVSPELLERERPHLDPVAYLRAARGGGVPPARRPGRRAPRRRPGDGWADHGRVPRQPAGPVRGLAARAGSHDGAGSGNGGLLR